ncbi:MAG: M28 family peptidase [Dehalococcoidia bacterium]|nr:M28 family peptidase [Dehalococcoidia bacterium]
MSPIEQILAKLAARPVAPLHEEGVAEVVRGVLGDAGVPYSLDPFGNIIAHYRAGTPRVEFCLVAHMDHPGFEVARAGPDRSEAVVLGGVARSGLSAGTRLRLSTSRGWAPATVAALAPLRRDGRSPRFTFTTDETVGPDDWGVWELPDFEERGELLHLRAADDLAGCAVILATMAELAARGLAAGVYGVFTRAEEIGLVGASLMAKRQTIPTTAIVISLESSRHLPGAELGKGPVIRTGDLRRTFDHEAERYLHAGRELLDEMEPPLPVQRQLMYGGTCEATPFGAFGYRATGIALPLGNYHNQGADGSLEAEFIHRADLAGALALVLATIERSADPLTDGYGQLIERRIKAYRKRLCATAAPAMVGGQHHDAH